jgi:hypothetical protein
VKKTIIIFCILLSQTGHAFDLWAHRVHEYSSPKFNYAKSCKKITKNIFHKKFNFEFLKSRKFVGIEIDVAYSDLVNDLVVYHGSSKSAGPHKDFQCFQGDYVLFKDFLLYMEASLPSNFKFWIDLKNTSTLSIQQADKLLQSHPFAERFIVETESYMGAYLLKSAGLKTSLWLKIRGPKEDGLSGMIRSLKNKSRIAGAKIIGANRISQSCDTFLDFAHLFNNDRPKMCWNTNKSSLISHEDLKGIRNLKVVLE